jgi:hypothetical protein
VLSIAVLGLVLGATNARSELTRASQCTSLVHDGGFEGQRLPTVHWPWRAEGRAGIDIGRGLSYRGNNNAWARNISGWNGIRQNIMLSSGTTYSLTAFIRTSGNVHDGYFGFRYWPNMQPVAQMKYGPFPVYSKVSVQFTPTQSGWYVVFAGFWAPNQDAWIQVDNVDLEAPCNDTAGNAASA